MNEIPLLVLDRDYFRALWIEDAVGQVLGQPVRICTRLDEAGAERFAVAFLGRRAEEGETYDFARRLLATATPFTFVSNGSAATLPADLRSAPFLQFPATDDEIADAVRRMAGSLAARYPGTQSLP